MRERPANSDASHPQPAAGLDQTGDHAERRVLGAQAGDRVAAVGVERDGPHLRFDLAAAAARAAATSACASAADPRRAGPPPRSRGTPARTRSGRRRRWTGCPACPGRLDRKRRHRARPRAGQPVLRQRAPHRLGEHQRRPVGGRCHPIGEVQPRRPRSARCRRGRGGTGCRARRASKIAAHEVRIGERARRLGEIDCAVRHFGDIRAELQRPAVDFCDQRLELPAAGIQRQQAAGTVQTSIRPSRATCMPSGRPPVSATTTGSPPSGGIRTIRPSTSAGPDLPVGVDHDVFGRIAGHGDDGQFRRRKVRQRIDRRRRPADGIDRRLGLLDGHRRSTVTRMPTESAGPLRRARRCRIW